MVCLKLSVNSSVQPDISVFCDEKYPVGKVYAGDDKVKVSIFEDLEIKMEDILINL